MGRDIWYNLGETISKTAKDIGEKGRHFLIEAQKLQSRAGSEKAYGGKSVCGIWVILFIAVLWMVR